MMSVHHSTLMRVVYMSCNGCDLRYDNAVKAVVELRAKVLATTDLRGQEDVEVLDTLIETQGLLQKTVRVPARSH